MNYTSINQSKRLSELGLSKEKADMYYIYQGTDAEGKQHYSIDAHGWDDDITQDDIPCWSVGSLIKKLPNDIVYTDKYTDPIHCTLNLTKSGVGYCSSFNEYTDRSFNRCWMENPDLIDALYNCVVWLLEEGHIKKGE